jgi:hypothetical protein
LVTAFAILKYVSVSVLQEEDSVEAIVAQCSRVVVPGTLEDVFEDLTRTLKISR